MLLLHVDICSPATARPPDSTRLATLRRWPFMVGAGITFYLVNAAQNAMLQSDEFKNSPKNPHRISSSPAAH
ncbi:atp18 subunit J of the mitochondrial F1F0 ATP synthase [Rhodotorula toruloides]